jgi:hypothetical protein
MTEFRSVRLEFREAARGVICQHGEASSSSVRAARVLGDGNNCSVWSRRPRWQARRPGVARWLQISDRLDKICLLRFPGGRAEMG